MAALALNWTFRNPNPNAEVWKEALWCWPSHCWLWCKFAYLNILLLLFIYAIIFSPCKTINVAQIWSLISNDSSCDFVVCRTGHGTSYLPDLPVSKLLWLQGHVHRSSFPVCTHLPGEIHGQVRRLLVKMSCTNFVHSYVDETNFALGGFLVFFSWCDTNSLFSSLLLLLCTVEEPRVPTLEVTLIMSCWQLRVSLCSSVEVRSTLPLQPFQEKNRPGRFSPTAAHFMFHQKVDKGNGWPFAFYTSSEPEYSETEHVPEKQETPSGCVLEGVSGTQPVSIVLRFACILAILHVLFVVLFNFFSVGEITGLWNVLYHIWVKILDLKAKKWTTEWMEVICQQENSRKSKLKH